MAKQIANVDILTDTFATWVVRTNDIIDIMGDEVLTANSTVGITGSEAAPKNSRLYGNFTATTLASSNASFGGLQANNTHIVISPTTLLVAGGNTGLPSGQYLSSNGTHLSWATAPGTGTVSYIANGAGIIGGPITTTGTLRIKAGDGIIVDQRGVSVNTAFISTQIGSVNFLKGFDWENPGAIGAQSSNTGRFSTVTATTYRITDDTSFEITRNGIKTAGNVDSLTPGDGTTNTTGGVRIRARGTGRASLQFTNQNGSTEYANITVDSNGRIYVSGNQSVAGSLAISTNNAAGGGLVLSDDGDFVDLNDGYGSLRFTSGIAVYSQKSGGSQAIRLKNTGDIEATGNIYTNTNKKVLTVDDFTDSTKNLLVENGGYTTLPNGLLLQWGFVTLAKDQGTIITLPVSYNGGWWRPIVSTSVQYGKNEQQENFGYAGKFNVPFLGGGPDSFRIYNTENFTLDGTWFVIGKAL